MDSEVPMFIPNVGGNDLLTQLQTYLAGAKVRLCSSPVPEAETTVVADLTAIEATYTGYAAKTITAFTGPYDEPNVGAILLSPLLNFSPTGTAVGNIIYGGWVESAAGVLEMIFQLANPFPLNGPTDVLPLVIQPSFPGPGTVHQLD